MVKDVSEIEKFAFVNNKIKDIIKAFMPGPLTLLLKAKPSVPSYVTHNTGVIGIRVPTNIEAITLLKEVDLPLLVPSANKSGESPALTSEQVKEIFSSEVAVVIDGVSKGEHPSTIVDFTKEEVQLIRKGPIPFDDIKRVLDKNHLLIEETVICYIYKKNTVLMLYRNKKKHDINRNKWIGVGGHIERGESPEDAVVREVWEETTLKLNSFQKVANVIFHFGKNMEIMHVYTSNDFEGRIKTDSPEGKLQWIARTEVLHSIPIWEGDKYFLQKIFNKEPFFEMAMWYKGDKLLKYKLIKQEEE